MARFRGSETQSSSHEYPLVVNFSYPRYTSVSVYHTALVRARIIERFSIILGTTKWITPCSVTQIWFVCKYTINLPGYINVVIIFPPISKWWIIPSKWTSIQSTIRVKYMHHKIIIILFMPQSITMTMFAAFIILWRFIISLLRFVLELKNLCL